MIMEGSFMVADSKEGVFHCRCCGEKFPMGVGCSLDTVLAMANEFRRIHEDRGCSQEKYLKMRLLKEM